MIGYSITYSDTLEKGNGFTSERVFTKILDYWSNEENIANFNRGYKFGLLVFGISGVFLSSTTVFASDNGIQPINDGGLGSCLGTGSPLSGTPGPGPAKPGGLANVPTADRGVFGVSALSICGIAMKSGAYWIGFVCAAAVIVGVHMVAVPVNAPL